MSTPWKHADVEPLCKSDKARRVLDILDQYNKHPNWTAEQVAAHCNNQADAIARFVAHETGAT